MKYTSFQIFLFFSINSNYLVYVCVSCMYICVHVYVGIWSISYLCEHYSTLLSHIPCAVENLAALLCKDLLNW